MHATNRKEKQTGGHAWMDYELIRTRDVSFFQEAELSRDLFGFVDTKKELRNKPRNLDETSLVLVSLAAGNPTQAFGIIEIGL
jgi:hypothetical protein